ncbi:hypothetical protein ASA1KI_21420 [Opitutales bacterium ASA1]|uniref:hypothetical protein n=1 Tax=Congregicoccus parvus TaxID=3081749 RepID=UPI002B307745|nr:hypothetical protein ASA1KI_21420 [Opitutales bacterium ASA1]
MEMSPNNSSLERFRELLLNFLWRQWSALGVAGQARTGDPWCVDPEALLLFTSIQARFDPRLFDEMLDWLWNNAHWLNVQRLRNLQKIVALGHPRIVAAIAGWLAQRATLSKWRPLAQDDKQGVVEPLFLRTDFQPLPVFGDEDEIFHRFRWRRGAIKRRELGQPPNPHEAAALLCKLRALFGVQARCEVLLWLLAHESGNPAEIARATAYFPKTVENTLNEMSGSGLIRSARHGREKHYWVQHDEWRFLRSWTSPDGFPQWIDWARLFSAIEQIMFQLARTDLSPLLLSSELRRVMDELQPVLADGRLLPHFAASSVHTGARYADILIEDFNRLLG